MLLFWGADFGVLAQIQVFRGHNTESTSGVVATRMVVQDMDASFDRTLRVVFTSTLRKPLISIRVVGCLSNSTIQDKKGVTKCKVRTLAYPLAVELKSSVPLNESVLDAAIHRRVLTEEDTAVAGKATFRLTYEITFEVIDPAVTHLLYMRVDYTSMKDALLDLNERGAAHEHPPAVGVEVAGANPIIVHPDVRSWREAVEQAIARGSVAAKTALGRGKKIPRRCAPRERGDGHGHWRHSGNRLIFDPALGWTSSDQIENGNGELEFDLELDDGSSSEERMLLCRGDREKCKSKPCAGCSHCDPRPSMRPSVEAMAAWRWIPRKCIPRRFSSSEAAQCLREVGGLTIVGDSVALQLRDRLSCAVGTPGAHNELVGLGKSPRGLAQYPGVQWNLFKTLLRNLNINHTRGARTPEPVTKKEAVSAAQKGSISEKRGVLAFNPGGLWQCGRGRLSTAQQGLETLLASDLMGNYDRVLLIATNAVSGISASRPYGQ